MKVSCYAGYRGEETPRRFTLEAEDGGSREIDVVAVEERWREPHWRAFRVRGDDGKSYLLRQELDSGRWDLGRRPSAQTSGSAGRRIVAAVDNKQQ